MTRTPRRLAPLFGLLVVVAGCSGATPSLAPTADPSSPPNPSAEQPAILPILVSSEILAGPNRFLFSLTDRANAVVAAPDVDVALEFYDVSADANAVAFTSDSRFLWAVEGEKGLYAADVAFLKAGRWGARFTATFPDGREEQVRADFDVAATGSTPAIGAAAVSIETPTAEPDRLATVSTDPEPVAAFYETSVADALSAKEPFVLVFATPAFCQTAICGPTLEKVKAVAAESPSVTFINVEPYRMVMADGRLQPELAGGRLQSAPWTDAWGLRTEPWVFVVDAEGKVSAKFEAVVGEDELSRAVAAVAPQAGTATGIVTAVDQASVAEVNSFTLRTDSGEERTFAVGDLDLSGGAFNAGHLREHMATVSPINVEFVKVGRGDTTTRLTDAE